MVRMNKWYALGLSRLSLAAISLPASLLRIRREDPFSLPSLKAPHITKGLMLVSNALLLRVATQAVG